MSSVVGVAEEVAEYPSGRVARVAPEGERDVEVRLGDRLGVVEERVDQCEADSVRFSAAGSGTEHARVGVRRVSVSASSLSKPLTVARPLMEASTPAAVALLGRTSWNYPEA